MKRESVKAGMDLANYLLFWWLGREGHCNLEEVAGGASSGRGRVMRHKGWLMDFVCPAYLHFRGRNHHHDILPGTGGDPGQQQPSGGARACMETLQSRTHPGAF